MPRPTAVRHPRAAAAAAGNLMWPPAAPQATSHGSLARPRHAASRAVAGLGPGMTRCQATGTEFRYVTTRTCEQSEKKI